MIWRLGYRLLLWLLFPWALLHLWWRGRRQPGYREHIAERFGWYQARLARPVIWLHAVSVGETRAADPLVRALAARYPGHELLLTQMTPTGRETAQQLYGGAATIAYLPYDYPGAVARFLARFRPRLGILKFDVALPPQMLVLGAQLKQRIGQRPVLLAASTREGEEELVLEALSRIRVEGLLLLLVPRHPQRFDEVAALLARRNLSYLRRSDNCALPPDCRVLLGDSMGEMTAYYAACDLAFIGGSLLPYGGQNLIEACAVGRPLLFGRHMYNFAEASRLALAAGAAIEVADAAMLGERAGALLADQASLARMSQAALAFSRAHQGATARTLAICERLLPPP